MQVIGYDSYILLNMKLARCLDDDFVEETSLIDAKKDWEWDRQGKNYLEFQSFFVSLFELADVWTPSLEASDYVGFLQQLLEALSYQPEADDAKRHFKPDEHICTVSLVPPLPEEGPPKPQLEEGPPKPQPDRIVSKTLSLDGSSHTPLGLGSRLASRQSFHSGISDTLSRAFTPVPVTPSGLSDSTSGVGEPLEPVAGINIGAMFPPKDSEREPHQPHGSVKPHTSSLPPTNEEVSDWEAPETLPETTVCFFGDDDDSRPIASRGNRTAAMRRMDDLGGGMPATEPLRPPRVVEKPAAPPKPHARWTVEDVFLVADRICTNDELTLGEIISHLYGTEYDGFAHYLKSHMVKLDRSHDGAYDRDEIRRALKEYTTKVLPKDLKRSQSNLADKKAMETVPHTERIKVVYKNIVVYTTAARLDSFRNGKCDWNHAVLKPSPVWSMSDVENPGASMAKDEVLRVCGNKHIANAMSKILLEGTVEGKCRKPRAKLTNPGRAHDTSKPNLVVDHHIHPGARINARVAAMRGARS